MAAGVDRSPFFIIRVILIDNLVLQVYTIQDVFSPEKNMEVVLWQSWM
jgi:hypothetical protein